MLGRHFVIRTDHAALSWLRRTPEPMPQLARWLTLIEQYEYEVVHRSGKRHGYADGLSRRPEATESDTDSQLNMKPIGRVSKIESAERVEPSLVRENLPELQRADPELGRIIQLELSNSVATSIVATD